MGTEYMWYTDIYIGNTHTLIIIIIILKECRDELTHACMHYFLPPDYDGGVTRCLKLLSL